MNEYNYGNFVCSLVLQKKGLPSMIPTFKRGPTDVEIVAGGVEATVITTPFSRSTQAFYALKNIGANQIEWRIERVWGTGASELTEAETPEDGTFIALAAGEVYDWQIYDVRCDSLRVIAKSTLGSTLRIWAEAEG